MKIVKEVMVGMLVCFVGSALANEITIVNSAKKSMTVEYKPAYKNTNGPVTYGVPQTIEVMKSATLPVELNGHQMAGIVPISITLNGHTHVLPDNATQFAEPQQCSLATDKEHPNGVMTFSIHHSPERPHRSANCAVKGGIFG